MQTWPQGVLRSYGTLNSHSQIWRLWNVNCRTVWGSAFLGFLPVVHQKWNIRCSDLLHKELRAECSYLESLDSVWWTDWSLQGSKNSQFPFLFQIHVSPGFRCFQIQDGLDSKVQPSATCMSGVYKALSSWLHHTSTSRWADWHLWVMDEAKERKQSSWHEIIMTIQCVRQGKVRSCRSPTRSFSRPCTKSPPLPTRV